jgi:hypothetical protein
VDNIPLTYHEGRISAGVYDLKVLLLNIIKNAAGWALLNILQYVQKCALVALIL